MVNTYTAREIASLTGLSFNNVRVRIHRLKLEPVEVKYGRRFYSEQDIERIRKNQ